MKRNIVSRILNYLEYMERIETGQETKVISRNANRIVIKIGDETYTITVRKRTPTKENKTK